MKKWRQLTATCFYLGYSPWAPGTLGSLAGLGIVIFFSFFKISVTIYLILIGLIFFLGFLSTEAFIRELKQTDPQVVVVDEVVGMMIAMLGSLQFDWKYLLGGFAFFRLFDIWKPFPIHRLEALPGSWGVMMDDVLAGIYAAICLYFIKMLR